VGEIVVGVDGSAGSFEALRFALVEARLRHATVRAVYAHGHPWSENVPGVYAPPVVADLRRRLRDEGKRVLDSAIGRALAAAGNSVEVASELIEAPVAEALITGSSGADLLVVGSRGRGGFTGLLLGSVSQHCARHATCPVVIVPPRAGSHAAEAPRH
jgi:nucleotide-binding universal stress UspA family protein